MATPEAPIPVPPSDPQPLASPPSPQSARSRPPGRKRRIVKWCVRLIVGVPLLFALVTLLLMRSPVVVWTLQSQVRALTGCELQAAGAFIDLDGRLVMRDFSLRAPGVPGDAATFLTARRAVLDLNWSRVFSGDVRVNALRLHDPVFRISIGLDSNTLNIAKVVSQAQSAGGTGTGPIVPPRIDVIDGIIEFSEFDPSGAVLPLRTIHVAGSLTPTEMPQPIYTIRMQEQGRRGMVLDGRINLRTGASTIRLLNLALNTWTPETIPTAFRDIWRRLNVQGNISSIALTYDVTDGPQVEVVVENVSMSVPIPAEDASNLQPHDLALREVNGAIRLAKTGVRAEITGSIENQMGRSRIRLQTAGLSLNSALTCEIVGRRFVVTRDPEFLPYIPATAREYFSIFSGPTGEVDARVVISRGPPVNGKPGEINVTGGRLALSRGTGAFHKFPYRFEEMNGYVEFDDKTIRIVNMTGRSQSGAVMTASGIISPLTDDAMVDIKLSVVGVTVNDALLEAMPAEKRDVVETIFSRPQYDRLIAAGLIRDPAAPSLPGITPAAAAQANLPLPPEFALGGVCKVDIHVQRPLGADVEWTTIVDVDFPRAGVVVEPFPLPAFAENLRVHITDDDARLISGSFRALSGGTATVQAHVVFRENGVKVINPDVRIVASDIPIDAYLLHALPDDVQPEPARAADHSANAGAGAPDAPSADEQLHVGNVLRDLHLRGTVDAVALITDHAPTIPPKPGADVPDVDYDITVKLDRVQSSPTPDDHPAEFVLEDLAGEMRITRERFRIAHLDAALFRANASRVLPEDCSARLAITLDSALGEAPDADRGLFAATIDARAIDLAATIEQVVAIFSPLGARKIIDLRKERSPSGRLDVAAVLSRPAGAGPLSAGAPAVSLRLDTAENVEFTALGGRMRVDWPEGVIGMNIPGDAETPTSMRFDSVRIDLTLDNRPGGGAMLDGSFTVDPITGGACAPADFIAELNGWRFESPINVPLLERVAGPAAAGKFADLAPAGSVDALLVIQSDPSIQSADAHPARLSVSFAPRDLAFTYNRERIILPEVSGRVTLNATSGSGSTVLERGEPLVSGVLEEVRARSAHWSVFGDGEWFASAQDSGSLNIDVDFTLDAEQLDPPLLAMLPDGARSAISAVDAAFHGPFSLRDGRVRTSLGAPGATDFTGLLRFADLSFSAGLAVEHVTGTVDLSVTDPGDGRPTHFRAHAAAPIMRVMGVNLADVTAELVSGPARGEILLTGLNAKAHGGRLFGTARVISPTGDAQSPNQQDPDFPVALPPAPAQPSYSFDLTMSGVRLAPVLADFAAAGAAPEGPVGPPDPFTEPDPSRGSIDAWVSLSGVASQPRTRIGRGSIRIADGDVLSLPVILPLIQLSNFQFPTNDRLGRVTSTFYIAGNTAFFDDISVTSNSVAILGAGTLNLNDFALDMRFNSRSNRRLPLLSDILEALRNELVTTTITGTVQSPKVSSAAFVGTRRMIDSMFTTPSRFGEMDLSSEAAARAERDRRSRELSAPPPVIEPRGNGS